MKPILILLILLQFIWLDATFINQKQAIEMLAPIQSSDYPNADYVCIMNEKTSVDEHALSTVEVEEYRKILTDQARKNNSVYYSFDEDYGKIEVLKLEIIKANGDIIQLQPNEILQEKVNSFLGWMNIYSNTAKLLTGQLPGLEIGDIIHEKTVRSDHKTPIPEHNSFVIDLQTFRKYIYHYFELEVSKEKPMYMHEINKRDYEFEITTDERDDTFVYQVTAKDIPKIIYEPNMEDRSWIAHRLYFTTLPDWETISRWYHDLVEPHLVINQEIADKVKSLIKGKKTRKDKAAAIFYWVSNNVRYLGVDLEKNRPGFEPHDVTYTYETRGGVCRDKAALLVAMLREADIDADVILISSGSRIRPEVPITMFNHAIAVSYDNHGEPEFFFDPTDENTRDFLPSYEEDNSYLIASEKGETLRFIPVSPPDSNRVAVHIDLTIQSDNQAEGTISYEFKGIAETIFRNQFSRFTQQDASNFISDLVSSIHENAQMNEFNLENLTDMTQNLRITASISILDYSTQENQHIFIPYSCTKLSIDPLYDNYIMRAFRLNERTFDFKMNSTYALSIEMKLQLAKKKLTQISFPQVEKVDIHGFRTSLRNTFNKKKNEITVNYDFESSKLHFEKEDFIPIKENLSKLETYKNLYIIGNTGE